VTVNSCILPTVEGVIYSFEGSNEILSHGTIIDRHLNVIENCDVGYHKAYPIGFRVCMGKGKWFSSSYKLCHSKFCIVIYLNVVKKSNNLLIYFKSKIWLCLIISYLRL